MKTPNTNTNEVQEPASAGCMARLVLPSYSERCKHARATRSGDNWKRIKDGKTAIVIRRARLYGIVLLHESGKRTTKQDHYLAGEYYLLENVEHINPATTPNDHA